MGMWAAPDTEKKLAKAKQALKDLGKIQRGLWNICGDDELMDEFDLAQNRLQAIIKQYEQVLKGAKKPRTKRASGR